MGLESKPSIKPLIITNKNTKDFICSSLSTTNKLMIRAKASMISSKSHFSEKFWLRMKPTIRDKTNNERCLTKRPFCPIKNPMLMIRSRWDGVCKGCNKP